MRAGLLVLLGLGIFRCQGKQHGCNRGHNSQAPHPPNLGQPHPLWRSYHAQGGWITGWHLFGAKEPTAKTDMIFRGVLYVKQLQLKDKKAGGSVCVCFSLKEARDSSPLKKYDDDEPRYGVSECHKKWDRLSLLSPFCLLLNYGILFNGRMTEMVRQDETRREPGNLQGRQAQLEPSCHNANWSPQTQERWQVNHSSPCQPGMPGTGGRWGLRMVPKPTLQGRGPSARAKMFGEIFRRSLQADPLFSRTNRAQWPIS